MLSDDEITQKVEALRDGLRKSSQTSTNLVGDRERTDSPKRRTRKVVSDRDRSDAGGKAGAATGKGTYSNNQRSPNPFFAGVGQTDRRHVEGDGSSNSTQSDTTRIAPGRLIKDDDITEKRPAITPTIPPFKPKRGPGRPSTKAETSTQAPGVQADSNVKGVRKPGDFINSLSQKAREHNIRPPAFNWFKSGNTLNETEAEHFLEPLTKAYLDYGGYLDQFINTKAARPDTFFGDLTIDEAQVLARLTIRQGRKNAQFAAVVRTASEGNDYLSAIIIMLPRIRKIVEALREELPDVRKVREDKSRIGGIFNNTRR